MRAYVGHAHIREVLERGLPPVALFLGPESVGKWELAEWLIEDMGVAGFDVARAPVLSVEVARGLQEFVATLPAGRFKVIIAGLGGASPEALNAMLKTLEEPPDHARFILVASHAPLPTIASRSRVFRFGLLSAEHVRQVLVLGGMEAGKAAVAAPLGRGQVRPALEAATGAGEARERVQEALSAVARSDPERLRRVFRDWGDHEHRLLFCWASEAAVSRYLVFGGFAVARSLGAAVGRRVLVAMAAYEPARPRIADRAILESLMEGTA